MRGSGALPARAVVHGQPAAVNERALGELGDVRVAPTIEVREEPGEDPQDEVGRQMKRGFPLAALEPGQPLSGGTVTAFSALAALPPRDAKVLRLYFGLDDGNSRTLEEIGRMMGVTRERIRQLRDRALLRLREGETGDRLRDLVA